MKRIAAIGLVLTAGLGLSACGSSSSPTASYLDGWNETAALNGHPYGWYLDGTAIFPGLSCNAIYDYLANGYDLRSEFISGCEAAGKTTQSYGSLD